MHRTDTKDGKWGWLIGLPIEIVDYDDDGKIVSLGVRDKRLKSDMFPDGFIRWISTTIKKQEIITRLCVH